MYSFPSRMSDFIDVEKRGSDSELMQRTTSIGSIQDLPLEDAIRQRLESSKELNVLVVGRFQVGKSTLINCLFFERGRKYETPAKEGYAMQPTTKDVTPHTLKWKGISYNIYDSPGLQDGEADDSVYLRKIKSKCPKIHLIIYCTRMDDPVRPDEDTALATLTSTFGEAIWENVVIALTFANKVEPADPNKDGSIYFSEVLKTKTTALQKHFLDLHIESEIVEKLTERVFPTGSARILKLPGMQEDWRADLWRGCLDACQPEGRGALLKLAWSNPHFLELVGAGGAGVVLGAGFAAVGAVFTATGILAPIGVPFIAAGIVTTLLGVGIAANGAKTLTKENKHKKKD